MTLALPMKHRPRKRFGQHFLEPAWIAKVIDVIGPTADDVFLEIGAGRGALTRPLAARARHVVAVEIDRDLARDVRLSDVPRVTVVEGDFFEVSFGDLARALDAPPDAAVRV